MNRSNVEFDMEIAYVMDDIKRLESRLVNLRAEKEEYLAWRYGMTLPEFRAAEERFGKGEEPDQCL